MKYVWKDEYIVGIEEIDTQHKHFFEIFDELDELLKNYSDENEESLIFASDKLLNYALYHFSTEEVYLEKCACPAAQEHISSHDTYREKMQILRDNIRKPNKIEGFKAIQDFAEKYLIKHIVNVHEKYADCFKKCQS